jgi:hypothetical protein
MDAKAHVVYDETFLAGVDSTEGPDGVYVRLEFWCAVNFTPRSHYVLYYGVMLDGEIQFEKHEWAEGYIEQSHMIRRAIAKYDELVAAHPAGQATKRATLSAHKPRR